METVTQNKNKLVLPFILLLSGACLGAVWGLIWAIYEVRSIDEQARQPSAGLECGTGMFALVYGSPIAGFVVGAIPGLIVLLIVGLKSARREKSDWEVYYGK